MTSGRALASAVVMLVAVAAVLMPMSAVASEDAGAAGSGATAALAPTQSACSNLIVDVPSANKATFAPGEPITLSVAIENATEVDIVTTITFAASDPAGAQRIAVDRPSEMVPGGRSATFSVDATVPTDASPGSYTIKVAVSNSSFVDDGPVATDSCSENTGTFAVVRSDQRKPVFANVPDDMTRRATDADGAVVTYVAPSATNDAGADVPVTCSPDSGTTFPVGTTTVTCTASDPAAGESTAKFTVTVTPRESPPPNQDTKRPRIANLPANITTAAVDANGAVVSYARPTAKDDVDGRVRVSCSPRPGTAFPVGTTTVRCKAHDSAGNQASTSFTVTVNPPPPPIKRGGVTTWRCQAGACTWALAHTDVDELLARLQGPVLPLQLLSDRCTATLSASLGVSIDAAATACFTMLTKLPPSAPALADQMRSHDQGDGVLIADLTCNLSRYQILPQGPDFASPDQPGPGSAAALGPCAKPVPPRARAVVVPRVIPVTDRTLVVPVFARRKGTLTLTFHSRKPHPTKTGRVRKGPNQVRVRVPRNFHGNHRVTTRLQFGNRRTRRYHQRVTVRRVRHRA